MALVEPKSWIERFGLGLSRPGGCSGDNQRPGKRFRVAIMVVQPYRGARATAPPHADDEALPARQSDEAEREARSPGRKPRRGRADPRVGLLDEGSDDDLTVR